ncbi:hypothetical protein BJ170DRAFT_609667 [Xylariales sp. AK1849]|nr:hypothetical protein BJ170DRAFT_609667 [Xylariales sp. AK1849]
MLCSDFDCQTGSRRIWADALCIDQEDSKEKGSQKSAMTRIYRGASLVLVWLGKLA